MTRSFEEWLHHNRVYLEYPADLAEGGGVAVEGYGVVSLLEDLPFQGLECGDIGYFDNEDVDECGNEFAVVYFQPAFMGAWELVHHSKLRPATKAEAAAYARVVEREYAAKMPAPANPV